MEKILLLKSSLVLPTARNYTSQIYSTHRPISPADGSTRHLNFIPVRGSCRTCQSYAAQHKTHTTLAK